MSTATVSLKPRTTPVFEHKHFPAPTVAEYATRMPQGNWCWHTLETLCAYELHNWRVECHHQALLKHQHRIEACLQHRKVLESAYHTLKTAHNSVVGTLTQA